MGQDPAPASNPLAVPPNAADEWLALIHVLEEVGTVPCQATGPTAWWPDRKQLDAPPTHRAVAACRARPATAPCLAYGPGGRLDDRFQGLVVVGDQ